MGSLLFVIHKHKATSLHYDFRLEIGGVMPSWSIPKGPSLDPAVKRLAIPTTDHEMAYRTFEGVIPQGQYGAGPVMIWDEGTYNPEIEHGDTREEITDRETANSLMEEGLRQGELKFRLYGTKLTGSFALIRTHGFGSMKHAWLLIKHRDKFASAGYDPADYDVSAHSGRSMKDIEEAAKPPA